MDEEGNPIYGDVFAQHLGEAESDDEVRCSGCWPFWGGTRALCLVDAVLQPPVACAQQLIDADLRPLGSGLAASRCCPAAVGHAQTCWAL